MVGGSASGLPVLEDDFSLADQRSWLLHPGGTRMPVCGSSGEAFAFIEKANTRYAVTTDLTLTQDSFIQFDFSASCSVSNSCYGEMGWRVGWGKEGEDFFVSFDFTTTVACLEAA